MTLISKFLILTAYFCGSDSGFINIWTQVSLCMRERDLKVL